MPNEQREKRVRERAYAIYLARNGEGGTEEQDWLRAEQELADTVRTDKPAFAGPSKPPSATKEASGPAPQSGHRRH